MADKHTLAFEIGVEEIPAFDLDSANKQLEKMVPAAFADARIPYDSIEIHSSPRRLIVMAYGVADATEALVEEYKGPAAKIAFDADGNPTKAAIGFARGKGLSPENLERREVNGTEYVFATKNIPATPVADLLPDVLAGFITAIKWPRSCRWAAYREYFVRPVRWIVAMLDDVVLPVSFAGAESSDFTMGHRVLAPGKHVVDTAANLLDVIRAYMRKGGVHVQFNIPSSKTLREAQKKPDDYRDLMVRVAGFTQYWCEIGKPIQDEVIYRTEYEM